MCFNYYWDLFSTSSVVPFPVSIISLTSHIPFLTFLSLGIAKTITSADFSFLSITIMSG